MMPIQVHGLYSDILSLMWVSHPLPMDEGWILDSVDQTETWRQGNAPAVLEGAVSQWPAVKLWTRSYLAVHAAKASHLTWTWQQGTQVMSYSGSRSAHAFWTYLDCIKDDEPPAYLQWQVDEHLASDIRCADVDAAIFNDSSSALTSNNEAFLRIGPRRAGCVCEATPTGHIRWEAVISGSKKVVLRHISKAVTMHRHKQNSESTCACAWFSAFFTNTSLRKRKRSAETHPAATLECTMRPGDLLFVPDSWNYSELLLEESVSIKGFCKVGASEQPSPPAVCVPEPVPDATGLAWLESLT